MVTDPKRFTVDGIDYDQTVHDRMDTSGTPHISPESVKRIPDDECLCGTGFPCCVHPLR